MMSCLGVSPAARTRGAVRAMMVIVLMLPMLGAGADSSRKVVSVDAAARAWAAGAAGGALDKGLAWDGMLGRATLALVQQILKPAASGIAALRSLGAPLPPGDFSYNTSVLAVEASANVTAIAIDGLATIRPFGLQPVDAHRLSAASSFGSLEATVHVEASVRGPMGLQQDVKLICRAELHDVATTVRLRVATLATVARRGLRAAFDADGGDAHDDGAHSASGPAMALDAVDVLVGGEITFDVSGADGGGVPPIVWRMLSRLLRRALKDAVEQQLGTAVREVLQPLLAR